MFSLACNLTKDEVEFLPIEILLKKVRANTLDFSIIKLYRKKVSGNNVDFSTNDITSKKVHGERGFFDEQNYIAKVRGNQMDFLISEITLKKYMEMMWKFFKIWSLTYRCNIDVEST